MLQTTFNMNSPLLPSLLSLGLLVLPCCEQKQKSSVAAKTDEIITYETVAASPSGDLTAHKPPSGYTKQFQNILAKVNAQCPQVYPEVVTAIPDAHELEAMDANKLMGMLESWNPVLRMHSAKELGTRGKQAIIELRKGTHSENDRIRAGSATALAAICKNTPSEELLTDLARDFIRLSTDEEHEVRVAALQALSVLNPKTHDTTLAVLAMCTDPNEYLAQDAKVALNKYFEAYKLPIEDIETGLKAAMGGPLPNGKGHIVTIIGKLKPDDQRRFIPEMLEHVKWFPRRDTMFAAGGQEQALQMLTQMKVAEMVPHLPGISDKVVRGDGLFMPVLQSLQAFGEDAQPALTELKRMLADLESKGKESEFYPRGDFDTYIKELKKTIHLIEGH